MGLLDYQSFLLETYGQVSLSSAKKNYINAICEQVMDKEEKQLFKYLVNEGLADDIYEAMITGDPEKIDEGKLVSVIQWGVKKLRDVENKISKAKDKGSKYIKDKILTPGNALLMKVGGSLAKPFMGVIEKVGAAIKKAWGKCTAAVNGLVQQAAGPITKKIENVTSSEEGKKKLGKESKDLMTTASYGLKLVTGGIAEIFSKGAAKGLQEPMVEDPGTPEKPTPKRENMSYVDFLHAGLLEGAAHFLTTGRYTIDEMLEEIRESEEAEAALIESGHGEKDGELKIPFLSKILAWIGHNVPPFSMLHKLEAAAGDKVAGGLNTLSKLIKAFGGPGVFTFVTLGAIGGILIGFGVEQLGKAVLFDTDAKGAAVGIAGYAVPGVGVIYNIIKYTGIALAVYGLVNEIAKADAEGKGNISKVLKKFDVAATKEKAEKKAEDLEVKDPEPDEEDKDKEKKDKE
jgi:hypothetical protein